jgi:hypothetical protein
MKKLIYFTTAFIFLMVFVLPFVLALFIKIIPANDQPGYSGTRGVYGVFTVSQEFTSPDNNLTAIATTLGNPNLKNKDKIEFVLRSAEGNVVRTVTLSGLNVGDGAFVKFLFDPIVDSKDKKYIFTISSPGAGEEQVINVFVAQERTDFIGRATYGEEVIENGLPIVVYFKPMSRIGVASDIYASWLQRMF